jgi:CheY-like chemotaxis protein
MRIRQVLTNLISNAVKFTEEGEVSVSIIQPLASKTDDPLRFEVHDTGIGISETTLSRLFQPFVQADSATSRRFGGSGLGLSISKKLVELMGGTIGANSITGKGSCFWFTLPLKKCESEDFKTSLPSNDLSGKRILVVDDNATNRSILDNYLKSWGLTVSEADNGSAALMQLQTSILQGISYDLILLDMQMPVMDGLTLAKCLTQIPSLKNLPIILLSSDNRIEPTDYQGTAITQRLLKPLRQMQLYDAIVTALKGDESNTGTNNPTVEAETNLPNYQNKKVLVVEDNKINQKVIVAKLRKYNIVPDVAENGQLALEKLKHDRYDLVFMDCHMPVMDGYTATRELRLFESRQNSSRQTVIALTANALEGEREKCLEAGMDDYITKPIVTSHLLALLIDKLGEQHQ